MKNVRRVGLIGVLGCLVLAGCAGSPNGPATSPVHKDEITVRPAVLTQSPLPFDSLSLHGVRLLDPASVVASDPDFPSSDPQWIITRTGSRYRVADEKIVSLGVWNRNVLEALGLNSAADIERVFGKAQSIDEDTRSFGGTIRIHRYPTRGLSVIWSEFEGRVLTVNVSLPVKLPPIPKSSGRMRF